MEEGRGIDLFLSRKCFAPDLSFRVIGRDTNNAIFNSDPIWAPVHPAQLSCTEGEGKENIGTKIAEGSPAHGRKAFLARDPAAPALYGEPSNG